MQSCLLMSLITLWELSLSMTGRAVEGIFSNLNIFMAQRFFFQNFNDPAQNYGNFSNRSYLGCRSNRAEGTTCSDHRLLHCTAGTLGALSLGASEEKGP